MPHNTPWLRDTPGALVPLLRGYHAGLTKAETMRLTGLSRTAVTQRIEALLDAGYLARTTTATTEARGRPADRFSLDPRRGVFLVADTGATGMRTALCDALGTVLDERYQAIDITSGPEATLSRIVECFDALLTAAVVDRRMVLGIGLSLPGPVDHGRRRAISPPIMPGWHDFDIAGRFAQEFACPLTVEKDTNAMAFGEHRQVYPDISDLVLVKLGTGIGTGLIAHGQVYRGADGAAGDIGHVPLHGDNPPNSPLCRCGNRGCVEAYAGGWALARDLTQAGIPTASVNDVIAHVRRGNPTALQMVERTATIIGIAVSDIVNMINPRMVIFGGQLAELADIILATARNVIYGRSLRLATQHLRIASTTLPAPGVHGLAQLLVDDANSVETVDAALRSTGWPRIEGCC